MKDKVIGERFIWFTQLTRKYSYILP